MSTNSGNALNQLRQRIREATAEALASPRQSEPNSTRCGPR